MNDYNNEEIEKIRHIKSLLSSCNKLDKSQLTVLFQTGGFTEVSEKVIEHIFHQLDEDNTGYVSSDQLLAIVKSLEESTDEPENNKSPTLQIFSNSPPLYSEFENHLSTLSSPVTIYLFTAIDQKNVGLVNQDVLMEYLQELGVINPIDFLNTFLTPESQGNKIGTNHLSKLIIEELNDSVSENAFSKVSLAIILKEMNLQKCLSESQGHEMEKLKNDLIVSNERLAFLSVEMDENEAKQEEIVRQDRKKTDQRHQEQMRILKKSNEIELDIKSNLIEEQQRQIKRLDEIIKTQELKQKKEVEKLRQQNEYLENKLSSTKFDLEHVKDLNTSLTFELQNPSQQDNYDSMELSELMVVNKHLKDKNDELIMQLQSLTNTDDDIDLIEDGSSNISQRLSVFYKQSQPESLKKECKKHYTFTSLAQYNFYLIVFLPSPEESPSVSVNSSRGNSKIK